MPRYYHFTLVCCLLQKKPYITRFRVIQGILLSQCCRPRMTVSRGFLKSNCSHTTNSLTYCRRTYLLDITCFECAPNCALSMSRAIVLCYFYKASAGLCRTREEEPARISQPHSIEDLYLQHTAYLHNIYINTF